MTYIRKNAWTDFFKKRLCGIRCWFQDLLSQVHAQSPFTYSIFLLAFFLGSSLAQLLIAVGTVAPVDILDEVKQQDQAWHTKQNLKAQPI